MPPAALGEIERRRKPAGLRESTNTDQRRRLATPMLAASRKRSRRVRGGLRQRRGASGIARGLVAWTRFLVALRASLSVPRWEINALPDERIPLTRSRFASLLIDRGRECFAGSTCRRTFS
jgi:hypothetical protein